MTTAGRRSFRTKANSRAEHGDGVVYLDPFVAVVHQTDHPVARLHAEVGERAGEATGAVPQFAVGQRSVVVDQGDPVAEPLHRRLDELVHQTGHANSSGGCRRAGSTPRGCSGTYGRSAQFVNH
jgi:hypothetical protein